MVSRLRLGNLAYLHKEGAINTCIPMRTPLLSKKKKEMVALNIGW